MSGNTKNKFRLGDLVCDYRETVPRNVYRITMIKEGTLTEHNWAHLEILISRKFFYPFFTISTRWLRLAEPEELL